MSDIAQISDKQTIRSLLGALNDSQSTVEATHYVGCIVKRAKEDIESISEYLHCGHVDWNDLLAEKMKTAGWRGGCLGPINHLKLVGSSNEK